MTCIVGVVKNGRVYLGGDSAGVAGYAITVRQDPKVFRNGEFVFGFTTSFRMGQLLRYRFTPPAHPEGMPDMRYLTTLFTDAVRECFKAGGYARSDSGEEEAGCFLLGYRGVLYQVDSDYQVGIPRDQYAAVGCGAPLALGSLHTTAPLSWDPLWRVYAALEAASEHNAGVCPPYFLTISDPQGLSGG